MNIPTLSETSMAGLCLNRLRESWGDVKLVAMYRNGRHTAKWEEYTAQEVAEEILLLTTAWRMLGLKPQERVALMSVNRPRWLTTLISLLSRNAVTVPVYPTLTAQQAAFILRDSDVRYIVVDTVEQAAKICSVFDELPGVRKIFVMDPISDRSDLRVRAFDDLITMAGGHVDVDAVVREIHKITGDDAVTIVYTSGTTGRPKGVVLSNTNILSQQVAGACYGFTPDDIFLNHLPFSHSFGLTADLFGSIDARAKLVISDGIDPEQIRHSLVTIRPTVLMSVPRLFEKLYVQIQQVVSQKPARIQKLFRTALDIGKRVFDLKSEGKRIPATLSMKSIAARLITGKVLRQAGLNRVRIAYAGGAPISTALCYFFQSLGIDLYQGYGLTETSPIANVNLPGKNKVGTVGPPIDGVAEKIADDGELLIRGNNVMKGYHNNPEATSEAIDEDRWFHTGDIASFDDDGYVKILDRKKELIITSAGKNIAPLGIEMAFNTEVYIERVVVIGDGRKYLTALVCPNFNTLGEWASRNGLQVDSDADLAANTDIVRLLEERVAEINKGLARFEQIKKIAVMDHTFSEQTGELTPTLKLKRRIIDSMYIDAIESL